MPPITNFLDIGRYSSEGGGCCFEISEDEFSRRCSGTLVITRLDSSTLKIKSALFIMMPFVFHILSTFMVDIKVNQTTTNGNQYLAFWLMSRFWKHHSSASLSASFIKT